MADDNSENDDDKRHTVPVRVATQTRDKWHDYVDEHEEWASVSDLIRGSVAKEISDYSTRSGKSPQANVDLDPIENQLDDIQTHLQTLDSRVERVAAEQSDDPITQLALEIREMIPLVDSPETIANLRPGESSMPSAELISTYGSVDDITTYFSDKNDTNEMQVRKAIDRLRNDLPATIKTVDYQGEEKQDKRICEVR